LQGARRVDWREGEPEKAVARSKESRLEGRRAGKKLARLQGARRVDWREGEPEKAR
jgi:hypothetical protein